MVEIKLIDAAHKADILLKNDPFPLYGRMIPDYIDEKWGYSIQKFPPEQCSEMTFPDEPYNYDEMAASTSFIGAYQDGVCIGLAILEKSFFKYHRILNQYSFLTTSTNS